MIDAEKRRALSLLRTQIREIEKPERAAKRAKARTERKARSKAIGKTAQGQRQERQHDKPYLAHTRLQPCILAGRDECSGRIDPAHLRFSDYKSGRVNPGMGTKSADAWVLPLCRKHHTAQHAAGNERRWWSCWGIDPNAECVRRYAAFKATSPLYAHQMNEADHD